MPTLANPTVAMAKHIRKSSNGTKRILSDSEAAEEDAASAKAIASVGLAIAVAAGLWVLFGSSLDSPTKKGTFVAGIVVALVVGWKLSDIIWAIVVLGVVGVILYFTGTWILS